MPAGYKINWDAQPLGRVADRVLAKKLGLSHQSVRMARVRRQIRSKGQDNGAEARFRTRYILELLEAQREPIPVREIHRLLLEDYGTVSHRAIYRSLAKLHAQRKIVQVRAPQSSAVDWGWKVRR